MNTGSGEGKAHILVIEDNPADVELLRRAFANADVDCRLTVLEDGAEAMVFVRQMATRTDSVPPDLAVLDLNLPKNDGLDVLMAMRAIPAFAEVPVAILSSSASPRERAGVEQLGVRCYITKPADLDEYLGIGFTLKRLMGK